MIPPSLSVDNQDAGTNSPPAILEVRTDLVEHSEPGPIVVETGATPGMLQIELIDTDLLDTLHVRIYVDYSIANPSNFRSACTAAPTGTPTRTATCDLQAVCDPTAGEDHRMNVVVFDREPLLVGTPPFKAMPEGGLSTGQTFDLQCVPPT